MKIKDLAYTAGIIDGEGSICLQRSHSKMKFRRPVVSVTSTSFELLRFLKKVFGGYICSQKTYKKNHKKSWVWQLVDRKAIKFLKLISPYLKERTKKLRAGWIVRFYNKVTPRNGKYEASALQKKVFFEEAFFKI